MSVFDIKENIKYPIDTVGYWYHLDVVNLGMTGTLESNAVKVFKGYTLDEVLNEMKQTKLKRFNKFFEKPTWVWVGDFKFITLTGIRLRRWLKKWVKKQYLADVDYFRVDTIADVKGVYIDNGEVIEWATGACFWIRFIEK